MLGLSSLRANTKVAGLCPILACTKYCRQHAKRIICRIIVLDLFGSKAVLKNKSELKLNSCAVLVPSYNGHLKKQIRQVWYGLP